MVDSQLNKHMVTCSIIPSYTVSSAPLTHSHFYVARGMGNYVSLDLCPQHEPILRYYLCYTTSPIYVPQLPVWKKHPLMDDLLQLFEHLATRLSPHLFLDLRSLANNTSSSSLSNIQLDAPRRSPRFNQTVSHSKSALSDEDHLYLDIDVTAPGTWLGCKGYKGVVHTGKHVSGELVFVKLWDGWKHSSEEADRESAVYTFLHGLWGTLVPRLIAHGGWGFCHVIVLEFIEVSSLNLISYRPLIIFSSED